MKRYTGNLVIELEDVNTGTVETVSETNIGLNEKLDDSTLTLEDTTVLQCSTFHFYGSYTPYGIFMDGGDGYWYGFAKFVPGQ